MNGNDTFIEDGKPLTPATPEFFFWLRQARRAQEPVVVLHAGAGRIAIPLAEQEIRVVAVEPDETRRAEGARRSEAAEVALDWRAGDAATFELPRRAGMVVLAEGHFERVLSHDGQRAVLRRVFDSLQIGGKVVLALAVPDVQAIARSVGGDEALRPLPVLDAGEQGTVYGWQSSRFDVVEQWVRTHRVYEQVDADGVAVRRWHRTSEGAYLWPRQVRLLLEWAGFEIEAVYGGWNDEPLAADSAQQVWVARRAVGR